MPKTQIQFETRKSVQRDILEKNKYRLRSNRNDGRESSLSYRSHHDSSGKEFKFKEKWSNDYDKN